MNQNRILFVDDEPNILASFKRTLRTQFALDTCEAPAQALEMVRLQKYAVIVSDLKMPEMDGITLLKKIEAISPDSIRIMLTGHADLDTAIAAVNEGHIFRFLTKPCPTDILTKTLAAGLHQYQLVVAEKELLKGTLQGSLKVLSEVLSVVSPQVFGRCERIKKQVHRMALFMKVPNRWQVELAATLSQIGWIALPETVLDKIYQNLPLSPQESERFQSHPNIGADLIMNIPRLEPIAEIIRNQEATFKEKPQAPLGAHILKAVLDYDILVMNDHTPPTAISIMERRGHYHPDVLVALAQTAELSGKYTRKPLRIDELRSGMIVENDIMTKDHLLLLPRGQELSEVSITRLKNYGRSCGVQEPLTVLVPEA